MSLSVKSGSSQIVFKQEDDGRAEFNSPFQPVKDFVLGFYRTAMGICTLVNYKLNGGLLMDQRPRIQGYCEKAAFYCGLNPTYPHITETHLFSSSLIKWEERIEPYTQKKFNIPTFQFPALTIHVTTGSDLNKCILKPHRNSVFGGGSMSYDAAFELLQKIFPETPFTRDDFLLTCGESFTDKVHKQILESLKGARLDPIIDEEGKNLIERLREFSVKNESFDLSEEMRFLTSAIITHAVFGNAGHYRKLSDAVDFMNIFLVKQALGGFTAEDKQRYDQSCQTFAQVINEILNDEESKNLPIFANDLTLAEKQGLCLVMFFAGQVTTSFALAAILADLALDPLKQKSFAEGILANDPEKIKELHQYIDLSLVKLPPLNALARKLETDSYISFTNEKGEIVGKLMREGERVTVNMAATSKAALESISNPTYKDANVFGEGANGCLGKHLAMKELRKITNMVLSEFVLEADETEFKYQTQATKVAEPFKVKAKSRNNLHSSG